MKPNLVSVFGDDVNPPALDDDILQSCVLAMMESYQKSIESINVIFMTNEAHTAMNKQYLNHDYPTDVITFNLGENESIIGEVYINEKVAIANAKEHNVNYETEATRLAIHGALHLCGLNDATDEEKAIMREAEDFYLKRFM